MNWVHIAQGANDGLSVIFVGRLLFLRLHSVYRIFCLYILVQLSGSLIDLSDNILPGPHLDYRITWMIVEGLSWVLSLYMVYALLRNVLATLPGILKFSRNLLNITFALAIGMALWSAKVEYSTSKAVKFVSPLGKVVGRMVVLDRAICSAALLAILAILCFVLWFPVQMPRNLAMFSIGFALYFGAMTASLLAWSLFHIGSFQVIDMLTMLTLSLCYLYWIFFLTPEGQSDSVRMGHSWQPKEQERLIGQLEAMNASLLRAARR